MSVIRQDPTTEEWVVIATDRARRPHDLAKARPPAPVEALDASCPFCPGNETMTSTDVLRLSAPGSSSWTVRVVCNKFPLLAGSAAPVRREYGPLFREMDGVGYHEVVVEGPAHNRTIALMTDSEVGRVLEAYQERYRVISQDPRVKVIIVFKNHGEAAGTSLLHPHSQLVATPVVPFQIRKKYEVAIRHYDETGRCLYCDLVQAETRAKTRIILETERLVVFHPFASQVPFETWIAPRQHQPSFGRMSPGDVHALARVLRRTLLALHRGLGNPDFNYVIHSAPVGDENKDYYLWHVQILPRLTTPAGFELGSGISVTTVLPEESAAFMRDVIAKDGR